MNSLLLCFNINLASENIDVLIWGEKDVRWIQNLDGGDLQISKEKEYGMEKSF